MGRILREVGIWDDSQRTLALNLLGVPLELRNGMTAVDATEGFDLKMFRLELVEAELGRLRLRKEQAFDLLDKHDRESAEEGIGAELSKPLRLIQRYESACFRRQLAVLKILNARPRTDKPAPPAPRAIAEPVPRRPPEPEFLEPLEDLPPLPPGAESWSMAEMIEFCRNPWQDTSQFGSLPAIGIPPHPRT